MAAKPKLPTKSQLLSKIAEATGLTKVQVTSVLDALEKELEVNLKRFKKASIPGLINITVKHKERTEARKGVPNPFKPGELMDIKAKPAHNVVRVRALKKLKDMA